METLRRIWVFLNRRRMERELAEEMAFHREMMDADSRPGFGNVLKLREEARDAWGWLWLETLYQDLKYGIRILYRSPAFSLASIAVLALSVGIGLSAFQLFSTLVLRPLPIREPDSIYRFSRKSPYDFAYGVAYPPVCLGLLFGLFGGAWLSQAMQTQLYGLSPLDPFTYLIAIGILLAAAALAGAFPVRRALSQNPSAALRYE